jgi:hypothetical protein
VEFWTVLRGIFAVCGDSGLALSTVSFSRRAAISFCRGVFLNPTIVLDQAGHCGAGVWALCEGDDGESFEEFSK